MKLVAKKIKDKDLLFKIIHEKGQLFYRYLQETGEYEIVYFSDTKQGYYQGKLDPKEFETKIKPFGFKVEELIFDDATGEIKISQ